MPGAKRTRDQLDLKKESKFKHKAKKQEEDKKNKRDLKADAKYHQRKPSLVKDEGNDEVKMNASNGALVDDLVPNSQSYTVAKYNYYIR